MWSALPYVIKYVLDATNLSTFLIIKYGIPAIILSYLLPSIFKKNASLVGIPLLVAGIMIVVCNLSQILFLSGNIGTWYSISFSSAPIITLLFSSDKKSCLSITSFLLAFIGCLIFISNEKITNYPTLTNTIYLIASVIAWVLVTLNIKKIQKVYTDLEITCFFNTLSFLSSLILYWNTSEAFIIPKIYHLSLIILLSIFSPMASMLFSTSLRYTPLFCILSQYLQLVFGLIIGNYFFSETTNYIQWIGAVIIILALFISGIAENSKSVK